LLSSQEKLGGDGLAGGQRQLAAGGPVIVICTVIVGKGIKTNPIAACAGKNDGRQFTASAVSSSTSTKRRRATLTAMTT
jgi:hypothetical protein